MLDHFLKQGKASFLLGGQWGSEGKGSCAAFAAIHMRERLEGFNIVTTNAGAQAGHTSTHDGRTKVVYHLPTFSLYNAAQTYLNAGSIIDPVGLLQELADNPQMMNRDNFAIHPNAAIITSECREAEQRDDSAQTKIASTRKGVGEALARKVLRSGRLAKDVPELSRWVRRIDLNDQMSHGASVLVEVPQGHSLSLDGPFYPHVTSRNCTVMQAMSDAGIHPQFYHQSMLVVRTFPIRVGNIPADNPNAVLFDGAIKGHSGGHFPDQSEISWDDLGVKPEITTVTKRVRRVFTFSELQVAEAIAQTRPAAIFLSFCDYLPNKELVKFLIARLRTICSKIGSVRHAGPEILCGWGPTTADVIRAEDV